MATSVVRERSYYSFALRVIRLAQAINRNPAGKVLWRQFLRSGTSIGANVEEAQAAQSKRDFVAKMGIARKEAHETNYWLRLFRDGGVVRPHLIRDLIEESEQIMRMLTAIVKTGQQGAQRTRRPKSART